MSFENCPHCGSSNTVEKKAGRLYTLQMAKDKIEGLMEENSLLDNALAAQTYQGNSVGYIYDKMHCYKDAVGTMGNIMQTLGQAFTDFGDDNIERRSNGLRWAERVAEERSRMRDALEEVQKAIVCYYELETPIDLMQLKGLAEKALGRKDTK